MMIQYMSDLHGEYPKLQPCAPYLALLGDIADPVSYKYRDFVHDASRLFDKVFVLAGNHEYYGHTVPEADAVIARTCETAPHGNVHFLQDSSVLVEPAGILVTGCTLWSEVDTMAFHSINDGRCIKDMTLEGYKEMHRHSVAFLTEQIDKGLPTVVLTHHAPLMEMNGAYYPDSPLMSAFATDLSHLMKPNVKAWLSGHTHQCLTIETPHTICSSNCRGYRGEGVAGFNPNKILQL